MSFIDIVLLLEISACHLEVYCAHDTLQTFSLNNFENYFENESRVLELNTFLMLSLRFLFRNHLKWCDIA